LDCDYIFIRTIALGSIENIGGTADEFLDICMAIPAKYEKMEYQYDARALMGLLLKWEIDPATLNI
jgi:hypothetical protein